MIMKVDLMDMQQKQLGSVELPKQFNEEVRSDLVQRAIMSLWNNPEQTQAMGKTGRENVETNFTMEIFARSLAWIFHKVANK